MLKWRCVTLGLPRSLTNITPLKTAAPLNTVHIYCSQNLHARSVSAFGFQFTEWNRTIFLFFEIKITCTPTQSSKYLFTILLYIQLLLYFSYNFSFLWSAWRYWNICTYINVFLLYHNCCLFSFLSLTSFTICA